MSANTAGTEPLSVDRAHRVEGAADTCANIRRFEPNPPESRARRESASRESIDFGRVSVPGSEDRPGGVSAGYADAYSFAWGATTSVHELESATIEEVSLHDDGPQPVGRPGTVGVADTSGRGFGTRSNGPAALGRSVTVGGTRACCVRWRTAGSVGAGRTAGGEEAGAATAGGRVADGGVAVNRRRPMGRSCDGVVKGVMPMSPGVRRGGGGGRGRRGRGIGRRARRLRCLRCRRGCG